MLPMSDLRYAKPFPDAQRRRPWLLAALAGVILAGMGATAFFYRGAGSPWQVPENNCATEAITIFEQADQRIKKVQVLIPEADWIPKQALLEKIKATYQPYGIDVEALRPPFKVEDADLTSDALLLMLPPKQLINEYGPPTSLLYLWLDVKQGYVVAADSVSVPASPENGKTILDLTPPPRYVMDTRAFASGTQRFEKDAFLLVNDPAVSDDGRYVFYGVKNELRVLDMQTGQLVATEPCDGDGDLWIRGSVLCRCRRKFVKHTSKIDRTGLQLYNVSSPPVPKPRASLFNDKEVTQLAITGEHLLALADGVLHVVSIKSLESPQIVYTDSEKCGSFATADSGDILLVAPEAKGDDSQKALKVRIAKMESDGRLLFRKDTTTDVLGKHRSFCVADGVLVGFGDSRYVSDRTLDVYDIRGDEPKHLGTIEARARDVLILPSAIVLLESYALRFYDTRQPLRPVFLGELPVAWQVPKRFAMYGFLPMATFHTTAPMSRQNVRRVNDKIIVLSSGMSNEYVLGPGYAKLGEPMGTFRVDVIDLGVARGAKADANDNKGDASLGCALRQEPKDFVATLRTEGNIARSGTESRSGTPEGLNGICQLQPGQNRTITLDKGGEMTFEFLLSRFGKCEFKITTDSSKPIKLKSGSSPAVFLVSKNRPLSLLVEHTKDKELMPLKVLNVTGRRTPQFKAELTSVR
jgi:hypothetical protein